jgi:hypothetical protein
MFALNSRKVSYKNIWILSVLLVFWSCAQQGSPSGGPRDETPPAVLECNPPNYSTRFHAKKIQITFDEYIVLNNANQELIVSPPMDEKPEVKLRKKSIIIEFEEALRTNTTYTFNFGNAIADLHEGNVLQNYEYVFSTGDILDSMSVKGTLRNAENLDVPGEPISVMLYTDLRDSVPLIEIPLYVGRSDDSGIFSVNNLRPDVYKVFALKDGNNNLLFDLPTEEIAFLDTSLIVNADFARQLLGDSIVPHAMPDSVSVDSLGNFSDSLAVRAPDYTSIYIDLMLFVEASEIQYLMDNTREDRRKLQLVYALPLTDSFSYRLLRDEPGSAPPFLEYFSTGRDSLTLWVMDSLLYGKDTIQLAVDYTVKDTTEQYVVRTDTLSFTYRERETRSRRQQEVQTEEEKLEVSTIRNNGFQDLNRDLQFQLEFPVKSVNDSLFSLFQIPDSIEVPVSFTIHPDTMNPYRVFLSTSWEPASQYRMVVLPGAISSIYPLQHDTIDVNFETRDSEYYGQILLSLQQVKDHVLIQLISNENLVEEKTADEDGQVIFSFLAPKEYDIKIIHDTNKNGKWDTGKYLEKRQPESVEKLPVSIEVRSNWDHEVNMTLEK